MEINVKDILDNYIEEAENFYTSNEERFLKSLKVYNGDPDYYNQFLEKSAKYKGISDYVSRDVADVIEWILPSLTRIFFGSENVVKIVGRTAEDVKPARLMTELINYQVQVLNNGFEEFYKWFKNALVTGGYLKVWWDKTYTYEEDEFVGSRDEIESYFKEKYPNSADVEIVAEEEVFPEIYKIKFRVKRIDKDQPNFKALRIDEVIVHPTSRNIEDSIFVAHRFWQTATELRVKAQQGIYDPIAVEKALKKDTPDSTTTQLENYIWEANGWSRVRTDNNLDKSTNQYQVYECYVDIDKNGDGIAEKWIITMCNGVIIREEENTYGRPPIFYLAPILANAGFYGFSITDLIADVQFLKTAVMRSLLVNLALSNNPKYLVDPAYVKLDDIKENSAIIRVNSSGGDVRRVVQPLTIPQIAPYTLQAIEMMNIDRENRTGITRYNQGLDAKSLNSTATGVSLIMQASNQRLELIARIFAETGIKDFFKFMVYLNNKFLSQQVVLRLTNEYLPVRPDDLKGQFDYIVNVGSVGADSQMKIQLLEQVITQLAPELLQLGITDPVRIRNMVAELFKMFGFKHTEEYISTEEEIVKFMQTQVELLKQQQGGQTNVGQTSNSAE